jgi:hypothetical protein
MVQGWVRDVTLYSNIFADNQIIYFYRYMYFSVCLGTTEIILTVFILLNTPTPISAPWGFFQFSNNKGPLLLEYNLPYSDSRVFNLSNNLSAALNLIMHSTSSPPTPVSSE